MRQRFKKYESCFIKVKDKSKQRTCSSNVFVRIACAMGICSTNKISKNKEINM